jgi:hypothetical protein
MHRSPITDSIGQLSWQFGGPDAWKQFQHRGFTVSIEWAYGHTKRRLPPVIAIWASTALLASPTARDGTWVISRTDIANFFKDREGGTDEEGFGLRKLTGGPSLYCFQQVREALPLLGKDPNDRQAFQALVDCVMVHGEWLARIPVSPASEVRRRADPPMWEITATNKATGKVLSEAEV